MLAPCKSNNGPHILLCSRGEISQVQILVLGSCKSNTAMHLHDWGGGGDHSYGQTHACFMQVQQQATSTSKSGRSLVWGDLCCLMQVQQYTTPTSWGGRSLVWGNLCCFMPVQHWTRPICVFWGQITHVEKLMLFHASPTLDQTHLRVLGGNHLCGETHACFMPVQHWPTQSSVLGANKSCGEQNRYLTHDTGLG